MTHKRFLAGFQVSMLFLKFCIDGIPVGFWQPTEDDNMRCPRMTQVCHRLQKDGNLLPLLLQVTFVSPTICNCLFHIFGLSMLSNVVQETVVTMALNIRKKTPRLSEPAKHRNQVCKTRHHSKLASFKLVQLAPRSFCHAADGI